LLLTDVGIPNVDVARLLAQVDQRNGGGVATGKDGQELHVEANEGRWRGQCQTRDETDDFEGWCTYERSLTTGPRDSSRLAGNEVGLIRRKIMLIVDEQAGKECEKAGQKGQVRLHVLVQSA
jgi:hypothetical protein